jgi:Spy/CpxP family protein refolding chaperone
MSKRLIVVPAFLITIILATCAFVSAQQPPPKQGPDQQQMQRMPPPPPDLADAMFPPEMIMQHARELNLTQEQKTFMREEINKTTTRFNDLQWQLQDAMEALHDTMKANPVNEQQALAQLGKVLDAEREIKTLHMAMNIHIKNKLTPDQQTKLLSMRNTMQPDDKRRDRGPDGPGRGPGRPGGPGPGGPGPGGPGGGGGPRPGGRPGGPPNF